MWRAVMSGQIVGEVLAASAQLQASGLPERAFYALIAIAEKAHTDTREGSVRWDHIRASQYGKSLPTAKRAVSELKSAGLIERVRKGFNNQAGRSAAPVYRVTERITQMIQSGTGRTDHPDDPIGTQPTDHSDDPFEGGERIKSGGRTDHPDELLDGPIDEKTRARPKLLTRAERKEAERARIRRLIDTCTNGCDAYGRLDDLRDCPKHPNLRQLRAMS